MVMRRIAAAAVPCPLAMTVGASEIERAQCLP